MLRAFNGDCDAAIGRVRYDNVARVEKRIGNAFEAINKLGATKRIAITEEYLQKRVMELHLVHEHREKLYQEKEEQREHRERMREEQKAEKEIEKARREGMSRALLKFNGGSVHDYATIADDSPRPSRASRARRAATSAGIF